MVNQSLKISLLTDKVPHPMAIKSSGSTWPPNSSRAAGTQLSLISNGSAS